jgi:hypothetical protein
MRRPAVVAPSVPTPATRSGLQTRVVRPSTGTPTPAPTNDSGGWALPPLNQFMTLPGRFLASRLGASAESSASSSSSNRNIPAGMGSLGSSAASASTLDRLLHDSDENWTPHDHFVLPHMVHFRDVFDPPRQPEQIDLTVSSSEDEGEGETGEGDSDDVIEILEPSGAPQPPQPTPLRRKRRRPGVAADGSALLVPKRQRVTDFTRSAKSTNVSIENSEAVEEFKRRLKCSICLDVLEDMTSTLCGHIFCAGCIHQAIRANGKCPLCQRHLHLKDTHRLFF